MSTIKFNARDLDGTLTHVHVEGKDIKLITVDMVIDAIADTLSTPKPFTVRLWNPKESKQGVKVEQKKNKPVVKAKIITPFL